MTFTFCLFLTLRTLKIPRKLSVAVIRKNRGRKPVWYPREAEQQVESGRKAGVPIPQEPHRAGFFLRDPEMPQVLWLPL